MKWFDPDKFVEVAMLVAIHAMWIGIAVTFYAILADKNGFWLWAKTVGILAVVIYIMTPSQDTYE